jgi:hypothetical protein
MASFEDRVGVGRVRLPASADAGGFLVPLGVFEFDVLEEAAFGTVVFVAPGHFAPEILFDFVGRPAKPFLPLRCFLPHFIFEFLFASFLG